MRLGAYACEIHQGTLAHQAYGATEVQERHRHRFEVNNQYREQLADRGLVFSGINPDRDLVEIVELPGHPWYLACQFHPEFLSRPYRAHPLFREFVGAAARHHKQKSKEQLVTSGS